jgi:uncharacterized alkaline shock family protein YloU
VSESVPGTVTIASEALVTIVRLAAQEIAGVHEMRADWARDVNRFLGNAQVGEGVRVHVHDNNQVSVDLFVVVDHDVNMLQLGRRVQAEITRAIEEMLGMEVREVNVHIEDVFYPPAEV